MDHKVLAYGLSGEQVSLLAAALPENCAMTAAPCVTDLIVTNAVCTIIDAKNMGEDALRVLFAYYLDVGDRLDEMVVWLGAGELPALPSFVRCDGYLQLLLRWQEILQAARTRYDTMQHYADVYAYLPKHAIAECLEADIFAAFQQITAGEPDPPTQRAIQRQWQAVLEMENGPQLLAGVYELGRWLQKEKIPSRWETFCFSALDWVMRLQDPFSDRSDTYTLCVSGKDLPKVENWLRNHRYFQNGDRRLSLHAVEGLETGIAALDLQIMGMQPGEVILVGGRPGMGKSRFAQGVARHIGKTGRVLYVDQEDQKIPAWAGVRVMTGGTFSMTQIRAAAQAEKPDIVIIDRLQRVTEVMDATPPGDVMGQIKALAQSLQIPLLVTTDLTDGPEERPNPSPMKKDIPEQRSVLPYVDTTLLLYRPAYYDPYCGDSLARCVVEQETRGRYKVIPLHWDDENSIFADCPA